MEEAMMEDIGQSSRPARRQTAGVINQDRGKTTRRSNSQAADKQQRAIFINDNQDVTRARAPTPSLPPSLHRGGMDGRNDAIALRTPGRSFTGDDKRIGG